MIQDLNKDIAIIEYNHLNLPTKVIFNTSGYQNREVSYLYDATGVKLEKIVNTGTFSDGSSAGLGMITHTQYDGGFIYKYTGTSTPELTFFSHPEGYIEPDNQGNYDYVYQFKDHLGNIRLSYKDVGTPTNPVLDIIEENNYYPFGLKHKGYNNATSGNVNSVASKFKYNGIEHEEALGLNLYEMQYRLYDPAIARWNAIDPVTHFAYSTYSAFDNNPVYWADPSGANSETMDIQDLDGNWHTLTEGVDYTTVYDAGSADENNDNDEGKKSQNQKPKHQFYGVNLTGDSMILNFDKSNFTPLTFYGLDPESLLKLKLESFLEVFKGLDRIKRYKLLRKLNVPLKIAKKLSSNLITPQALVKMAVNLHDKGLEALPIVGIIAGMMADNMNSFNRKNDNIMKWDDVRGGFNSMMNTKSLDDVILIYTNSNLESKKRIKTNLADFSTSRYPNNSYNRVYYGTQSSNTLYIYGSYELKQ